MTGEIEMHQREIDRLHTELVRLDATLRLFDPYAVPEEIEPKRH